MTLIAVKDGIMAADSIMTNGARRYGPEFPKIMRGPGGLIGVSGSGGDCYRVGAWFVAGEKSEDRPTDLRSGDDSCESIILRPDGTVWWMDERLRPAPTSQRTNGFQSACDFCEGALAAGMSAERAVALTIEHCTHLGGPVQVERLGGGDPGSYVKVSYEEMQRIIMHGRCT